MHTGTCTRTSMIILLFAMWVGPGAAHADPPLPTTSQVMPAITREKVQIVFALDTTGSMGGLIDGAKRKIWYIANEVLRSRQKPELEIGLVAYRDKGDTYVTKVVPLTSDLDAVYNQLMGFRADGGGDGPEHVNAALYDAVHHMQWSERTDVLKLIFLVGDAPPHMDYRDDVKHGDTSLAAIRQNIYINTIQCGADPSTTMVWRKIAHDSEGRFAAIPQDGGVVAIATPFDEELGRLGTDLSKTELTWGSRTQKAAKQATLVSAEGYAQAAPAATRAERTLAKSKTDFAPGMDMVALYARRGADALRDVQTDELPDELIGKDLATQEAILSRNQAERQRLTQRITDLEQKRSTFIAEAQKQNASPADAFDAEVVDAIAAQAAKIGFAF